MKNYVWVLFILFSFATLSSMNKSLDQRPVKPQPDDSFLVNPDAKVEQSNQVLQQPRAVDGEVSLQKPLQDDALVTGVEDRQKSKIKQLWTKIKSGSQNMYRKATGKPTKEENSLLFALEKKYKTQSKLQKLKDQQEKQGITDVISKFLGIDRKKQLKKSIDKTTEKLKEREETLKELMAQDNVISSWGKMPKKLQKAAEDEYKSLMNQKRVEDLEKKKEQLQVLKNEVEQMERLVKMKDLLLVAEEFPQKYLTLLRLEKEIKDSESLMKLIEEHGGDSARFFADWQKAEKDFVEASSWYGYLISQRGDASPELRRLISINADEALEKRQEALSRLKGYGQNVDYADKLREKDIADKTVQERELLEKEVASSDFKTRSIQEQKETIQRLIDLEEQEKDIYKQLVRGGEISMKLSDDDFNLEANQKFNNLRIQANEWEKNGELNKRRIAYRDKIYDFTKMQPEYINQLMYAKGVSAGQEYGRAVQQYRFQHSDVFRAINKIQKLVDEQFQNPKASFKERSRLYTLQEAADNILADMARIADPEKFNQDEVDAIQKRLDPIMRELKLVIDNESEMTPREDKSTQQQEEVNQQPQQVDQSFPQVAPSSLEGVRGGSEPKAPFQLNQQQPFEQARPFSGQQQPFSQSELQKPVSSVEEEGPKPPPGFTSIKAWHDAAKDAFGESFQP